MEEFPGHVFGFFTAAFFFPIRATPEAEVVQKLARSPVSCLLSSGHAETGPGWHKTPRAPSWVHRLFFGGGFRTILK